MKVRRFLTAALALTAIATLITLLMTPPAGTKAQDEPSPDVIRLRGTIHDFRRSHPDFGIIDASAIGHCAGRIGATLPAENRPVVETSGKTVLRNWYDKDGNPIAPYETDGGLPGGHFDVDVYDELSSSKEYHEHQFDDKFNVTYVDIVNDENLLFDEIVGDAYPNDLRVEFLNPHHGSGTFTFEADGVLQAGNTQEGFTATFDPATLTAFRVDFASLLDLKRTSPGDSQKDVEDRNDSFSIRMFDVVTGEMAYELAVYHHAKDDSPPQGELPEDACMDPIADSLGVFGGECDAAIESEESFGQWYRTVLGTNLSRGHLITLTRNMSGVYEYLADDFRPIDNQLLGNDGESHNNYFTYTISAKFTYRECTGQFFEFEGNDDAWVYIDDKKVIDLGGVATPEGQYVALDRLNLVDGREYTLDFFYAHRRASFDSIFRMRTNLELYTDLRIPVSGGYD